MVVTYEDMVRFREMEESTPKKLLILDTSVFFEIEIPEDVDAEAFVNSDSCREICAKMITDGLVDVFIERVTNVEEAPIK